MMISLGYIGDEDIEHDGGILKQRMANVYMSGEKLLPHDEQSHAKGSVLR